VSSNLSQCGRELYEFGPFRVDPDRQLLVRGGRPVALTPKAFQLLMVLVRHSPQLVTKDELMRAVWPDTFVEEANLSRNVFMLRKALGGSPQDRRCIVTVPGRGYRLAERVRRVPEHEIGIVDGNHLTLGAEVQPVTEEQNQPPERTEIAAPAPQAVLPSTAALARSARRRRRTAWAVAGTVTLVGTLLSVWVILPPPAPKVLKTIRLTHFGRVEAWGRVVSDGPQLYFQERLGGHFGVAKVSSEGGEPTELVTPFPSTVLCDISPDRSELLVGSRSGGEDEMPLWALPTSGGSPRRLGKLLAHDATWSPDGQRIAYASAFDVYRAKSDGSESRKLVNVAGVPSRLRWSPDGSVLRFTVEDSSAHLSLWEVSADGTNPHRLLAGWRGAPTDWNDGESGGEWTRDGEYFIFRSARSSLASIWAIREKRGWFSTMPTAPILLTTLDTYLWDILPSRSGARVFFAGVRADRELERYDFALKQFVPYLGGARARWASFSRDGQSVAYTTVPGFILWRSRPDGSEPLQLTFPPTNAAGPRWSPDSKRIAFGAAGARVYVVPSGGGNPEPVTPQGSAAEGPDWAPDGNSLLLAVRLPGHGPETSHICRLDLRTNQLSQLPGSDGLTGPAYSPDGKYVAAVDPAAGKLMLFEVHTQHWSELARAASLDFPPYWSRDGRYIYAQAVFGGVDQPLLRVRLRDHQVEVVATRNQFRRGDIKTFSLAGLTPDDSPLASILRSEDEIYAIDVDFP